MKRRMGRLTATVAVVTGTMLAAQGGIGAANPLGTPLYHFFGTVQDPVGRALPGASVSDAAQSTSTDSAGAYRLGERDFNRSFRLTASKAGMTVASRDVYVTTPVDTEVNFTLLYRTTVSIADSTISAATTNAVTALTATTFAPNPGLPGETGGKSCVTVRDSATGVWQPATLAGTNPDGSVRWTWELSVAAGSPERSGTLTARTLDCATNVVLAAEASTSYVVDNTGPTIADIQPGDGFNALVAGQYATATIKDSGGAGVDTGSIRFTVIDTTTLQTSTLGASYNATTGRAQAGPVALVAGHRYRVEVTVTDKSGNSTSFAQRSAEDNGGALAITVAPSTVDVQIPRIACALGEPNLTTNKRSVTCSGAVLGVGNGTVTLSGSTHSGIGYLDLRAPLHSARIEYTVATTPQSTQAYAAGTTRWVPLRYEVATETETAVTVATTGRNVNLPPVSGTLPALATDASLVLDPAPVLAAAPTCTAPATIAGSVRCSADPLLSDVIVAVKSGVDATALAAEHGTAHGFTARVVEADRYVAPLANGMLAAIKADNRVLDIARDIAYDYAIPAAQLLKHDITGTAYGQAAQQGVSGTNLRTFDLTAAAGLSPDVRVPNTLVVPMSNTTPVTSVWSTLQGVAGQNLDFGVAYATGGAQQSSASWVEKYHECYGRFQTDRAWFDTCARIEWLTRDSDTTRDGYSLEQWGTGESKSSSFELRKLRLYAELSSGSNAVWKDWSPRGEQFRDPCVSIQMGVTAYDTFNYGASYDICERWIPTKYAAAGQFANTWWGWATQRPREVAFMISIGASGVVGWKVQRSFCAARWYERCT